MPNHTFVTLNHQSRTIFIILRMKADKIIVTNKDFRTGIQHSAKSGSSLQSFEWGKVDDKKL